MLQLATANDRDAVNELARQLNRLRVRWRPDLYEMAEELYPQDRFEAELKARQLYVAKIDSFLVGYVLLKQTICDQPGMVRRKILYLEELCVQEACRDQGLGKEMVADVVALAKAFGCTDLQLGVYPHNDNAVGFFQKCGFTIRSIEMQRKV